MAENRGLAFNSSSATHPPRRLSLAGQFLLLQLVILLLVLVAVAATSLAQSARQFRDVEGRRALQIAENVAATSTIQAGLKARVPLDALQARLEQIRMLSGASSIVVTPQTSRSSPPRIQGARGNSSPCATARCSAAEPGSARLPKAAWTP